MKFRVTFKCPDALDRAITEAAIRAVDDSPGITDQNDREAMIDTLVASAKKKCERWFRYSEYVDVDVDIDAGTATVAQTR